MGVLFSSVLSQLSAQDVTRLRFASMLAVLVVALTAGFLAANRFGLSELWAKKIMTAVMLFFNWPIALLVIWQLQLRLELIWLPVVGVVLMLVMVGISTAIFSFFKLDRATRLTLILAGGLSNLGYTGGAFVCYAIFGFEGLAHANLFLVFWIPVVYLMFFPILKYHEYHARGAGARFSLMTILDPRCLSLPAVIAAIILNQAGLKVPLLVSRLYVVDVLVYVASALAFFSIGLRVKPARLRNYTRLYFPVLAIKFVLTPIVAFLMLRLIELRTHNLTALTEKVIMVLSVSPSAVLMVTMSNVFDLDGRLASALWVVTMAVFALVLVPLLFFLFA